MNRHDHALVVVDGIGRFAEALLRYDRISLIVPEPEALARVLAWFVDPGEVETLLIWLRDGVVDFIDTDGTLRSRVLEHPAVATVMKGQYRHARLKSFGRVRELASSGGPRSTLALASELDADLCLSHTEARTACAVLESLPGFQTFEAGIRFPAVRQLVDEGRMDLRAFIDLRRDSKPIREWMQQSDRGPLQQLVGLHDAIGRRAGGQERAVLRLCGDLHRDVTLPPGAVEEPEAGAAALSALQERFVGTWRPWIFDSG